MSAPPLLLAAPMHGAAGARLRPLLVAIAALHPTRFLVATPSELDLAPGPALTTADWLDDARLDGMPHLHILADHPAAAHVLRAALLRPGVTVLEDAGLARLYQSISLDAGDPQAWLRLLGQHHGAVGRRLGRAQLAGVFSAAQRHRMPMLDAVAEAAPLLVVRSRHALAFLPPGARAVVLPPGCPPAAPARAPGRVLATATAPAWLREAAALADAELQTGDDAGAAAMLALSLPFGTTPPDAVARALARGLPVLTWEGDPAAEWPEAVVLRTPFPAEPPALAAAIRALLEQAESLGAAALQHAAAHGADAAARALLALVPGCRVPPAAP